MYAGSVGILQSTVSDLYVMMLSLKPLLNEISVEFEPIKKYTINDKKYCDLLMLAIISLLYNTIKHVFKNIN